MRIWHQKLIPRLCQKHLCGMWRESLGCYKIITENKKGYLNHPATQEFVNCPSALYERLKAVRQEMLARNYNPKELPDFELPVGGVVKEWQTLEEQIEILQNKGCKCLLTK